jgi:fatty acid-binding protein DegV
MDLAEAAGAKERMAVVHGDCPTEGQQIQSELERVSPETPIGLAEVGAVIATYAGPGILGVGCLLAS